jgi:DNA-binding response OmpR family regulator
MLATGLAPVFGTSLSTSLAPNRAPTLAPSIAPTLAPSIAPTLASSLTPSIAPSLAEITEVIKTVLIVDDDVELAEEMAEALSAYGIQSRIASDWRTMVERLEEGGQDLILLDQKLGRTNALTQLAQLRSKVNVPILLLTGNPNVVDRLLGLELGADDFLQKPISGRELSARVHAHLRRDERARQAVTSPPVETPGWKLSEVQRRLYKPDGSIVALTSAEFELLLVLTSPPGVPVSRSDLTMRILKREYRASDRAMDTLVCRVRRKLGCTTHSECIVAVRNGGYVFTGFPAE